MESKKSILMFPWVAHGHIYPYLELAKHLTTKNFTIFFCSTPINLTSIKEARSHGDSINLIELHIPSSPELPPEYHTTKNIPPHLMPKLHHAFQTSRSSFSAIIASLKPDLLIYDVFQPWAAAFAASLSIPAVHFATTGAAAYSFYYHHFRDKNSAFPSDGLFLRTHEWKALQAVARSGIIDEPDQNDGFRHFSSSTDIVLMKTSRGIEGKYIDYLSVSCNKKILPVGPLITPHTTSLDHSHILQWLSKKKQFSTVFISFGSENYLSSDQIEAIAKGLEKSNVNFIWVLRFPQNKKVKIEEALPEGFLDWMREKERGLIVERWAPQTEILAHSSIGAFVSHCGMSSIVESVYFGVPIIAVPLKLDQPLNGRLMVEAGVAVEVVRDEKGGFGSEEVANVMNKLFVEKTGEEMRVKAAELSVKMRSEEESAVEEAAAQLRRICMEHKQWS